MSSIGPNRGGEEAHPDPFTDEQDAGTARSGDDTIEILEVVGMQEQPDDPPLEKIPPPGKEESGTPDRQAPGRPPAPGEGTDGQEELREQLLRARADFDNFRKRIAREKALTFDTAFAELMGHLLPVIDNLERALRSAPPTGDPFRQGIGLIHQQLMEALTRDGLAPIETGGADFDPTLHEAVEMVDLPGWSPGRIIEELQKGYMMKKRLLRPALVRVASGKRPGDTQGQGDETAG